MKKLFKILGICLVVGSSGALLSQNFSSPGGGPVTTLPFSTVPLAGSGSVTLASNLPPYTILTNPVFYGSWTNDPGTSNQWLRVTNFGTAGNQDVRMLVFDGDASNRFIVQFGTSGAYQQVFINGQHSGGPEWQWTGDGFAITPGYYSALGAIKDNRRFQIGSGENHRAHIDIFNDELADATATLGYSLPLRFRASWYSNAVFDVHPTLWAKADGTNRWSLNIYSNFLYTVTGNNWTSSNQVPQVKINFGDTSVAGVDMMGIVNVWGPGSYLNVSNFLILGNSAAPGITYNPSTNPDLFLLGGSAGVETDILQRDSANRVYFKSGQNGNVFEKNGLWVSTLYVTNINSPIVQATNAIGTWPVNAQTNGGFALINSNGTPYILLSGVNTTTWSSTNPVLVSSSVLVSNLVVNYFRARNNGTRQSYNVGAAPVSVALSNWVNITSNNFTYNLGTGSITNLLAGKYRLSAVSTIDGMGGQTSTMFWQTNGVAAGAENEYVGAALTYSPHNLGVQEFFLPANCHIQLMMENTAGASTSFDTLNQTIEIQQVP